MKNFKPIRQHDFKDCGICCMEWIINYYGGYIPLEKLREDTFTDSNGTSAYHIIKAFQKWGFDSLGVLVDDLKNSKCQLPLIAHLRLGNGLEHFVVVKEIKDDTIYLMDPSSGHTKMSLSKFREIFTGNVIMAIPLTKVICLDKGLSLGKMFSQIIVKEKFLFVKIIVTSLLWTFISIVCSYYLKLGNNFLNQDSNILKFLIITFGILTIIKVSSLYIREYYENHLANLVDVYIYPEFFHHLFNLPLKSIKSRSSGEIITRVGELANIKMLFSDIFVGCFLDSIMLITSTVILYIFNSKLFLIFFIILVVYSFFGYFTSQIIYHKVLENINYNTDFNHQVIENINMLESTKNLNLVNKMLSKIEYSLAKLLLSNYNCNSFFNLINLGKDLILDFGIFILNSYGLWLSLKGNINLIDLFTFNIILNYAITPVKNVIDILPKWNYIKASFNKITDFINIEEEKITNDTFNLKGDIVFEDVSYSYNDYDNILEHANLVIKDGEHVLLNGKSGSGKSTICKLIYKENLVKQGNIYIGNINSKDININVIRNNILYVSQNESLFTGTIRENILIERKIDNNKFQDICNICFLEDIVSKKNLRYESLIDATSNNLSGGEKQRIILARGLLKNANIIILDEALSEVDKGLESKIVKNIQNYFQDKTIIYISHKNQKDNFQKVIEIGG